jgi:hypothetical protein
MREKKSIKEFTIFIAEKCNKELSNSEIDELMFSFGWKYDQKI